MQYEEFADCVTWFKERERKENDYAWCVAASDLIKYNNDGTLQSVNLDIKNPKSSESFEHLPPEQLVADILANEQCIISIMAEIKEMLSGVN